MDFTERRSLAPLGAAWKLGQLVYAPSSFSAAVEHLCRQMLIRAQDPIELGEGQTFLIIVRSGRVVDYAWAMMPHVEFVKRSVGKLPDDAWVGTISKVDGELAAISSKTFTASRCLRPNGSRKR